MSALEIVAWIFGFLLACGVLLALIVLVKYRNFDPFDSEAEYRCLDGSHQGARNDEAEHPQSH